MKSTFVFAFFVIGGVLTSGCSPQIPAALNDLPDQLQFEHEVVHVTSDYTGIITINQTRERLNLSDEKLQAFQKVMEESEFFRHTDVYTSNFPAIFNRRDFYYRSGGSWRKPEGFSYSGPEFTSMITPVVHNGQPDAFFTDPLEIPFYAPYLSGESLTSQRAVIDYVKISGINKITRSDLTHNRINGMHQRNMPYYIGLFQSEYEAVYRNTIPIDYWRLSELFDRVWLNEFVIEVSGQDGAPLAGAEMVIHAFEHEGTHYSRFAFFNAVIQDSPFSRRYLDMFSGRDHSGFADHQLQSDEQGVIRLAVPLHPDRPSPQLHYTINAGDSSTSGKTFLDTDRFSIAIGVE